MVVPTVFLLSRCAERDKDGRVGWDKGVKGWKVIGDEEGGKVIDAGARHPMPECFFIALSLTFDLQCSHLSSRLENLSSLDQRSQKDGRDDQGSALTKLHYRHECHHKDMVYDPSVSRESG